MPSKETLFAPVEADGVIILMAVMLCVVAFSILFLCSRQIVLSLRLAN